MIKLHFPNITQYFHTNLQKSIHKNLPNPKCSGCSHIRQMCAFFQLSGSLFSAGIFSAFKETTSLRHLRVTKFKLYLSSGSKKWCLQNICRIKSRPQYICRIKYFQNKFSSPGIFCCDCWPRCTVPHFLQKPSCS